MCLAMQISKDKQDRRTVPLSYENEIGDTGAIIVVSNDSIQVGTTKKLNANTILSESTGIVADEEYGLGIVQSTQIICSKEGNQSIIVGDYTEQTIKTFSKNNIDSRVLAVAGGAVVLGAGIYYWVKSGGDLSVAQKGVSFIQRAVS